MSTTSEALAQALKCQQAGQLAPAEQMCRQILQATPDQATARVLLASVLLASGKPKEATAHARLALQVQPANADAYNLLGVISRQQGNPAQAVAYYREAVRLQPDHAGAHRNLAQALAKLGQLDEAIPHRRQVARLLPQSPTAHSSLGTALMEHGDLDEAVACFREALRLKPDYAEAHNHLGATFMAQGKAAEAAACYLEALRLRPNYPLPYSNLAKLAAQNRYDFSDEQRERLKTLLAKDALSLEDRSLLHFAWARLHDKDGACDVAFDHYRQANDLQHRAWQEWGTAFDAGRYRLRIDRTVATFDRTFFERTKSFGCDSELPVFVLGMPRSGTTLVEQILSSHRHVFGGGERDDIRQLLKSLQSMHGGDDYLACIPRLDRDTARSLAAYEVQCLSRVGRTALRVIDKTPHNFLYLGFIVALFPRARIIHCRRDPMDVCLSCYFQDFKNIHFASRLEDIGFYYRQYQRLMAHWREVLPVQMYEVAYEDLVANPEAISRDMVAYLGLEWDERCLAYMENPRAVLTASSVQVRQPIYKTSVRRWKRYEAHLGPLIEALNQPDTPAATTPQQHVSEWLAAGLRQHQAGNLHQAERIYQEIVRAAPNHAEAGRLLATVLLAQGKVAKAARHAEIGLKLQPDNAEVHYLLGGVRERQGKIQGALACYREATRLQPDHVGAHDSLGKALSKMGHFADAIRHLREVVRLLPDWPDAHSSLGVALLQQQNLEEASACFQEALRLKPDWAEPHHHLGAVLLAQGRFEDAVARCQTSLRLDPEYPMPYITLSKLAAEGRYGFTDEELNRIQTLLARSDLPAEHAAKLHYAVAVLRDRQGAYDEAFHHYRVANDLQQQLAQAMGIAFDAAKYRLLIDQLIGSFNRAFFERTQGFGCDSELPVFVVGMPRSGTTLVEQILSSHPQVVGAGELHDIRHLLISVPTLMNRSGDYVSCIPEMGPEIVRTLASRYLERLARVGGEALRVIDKMPHNFRYLGFIATLFPRCRIIHCRRDVMDVCLSCYFQDFQGARFASRLEDIGFFYRQYERLMAHWRAVLPVQMYEVAYEDLVANQEEISRAMVAYLGLEWDERCLAYTENTRAVLTASSVQVRQPIYKTSVQRWKHYEAHLKPLIEALSQPDTPAATTPQQQASEWLAAGLRQHQTGNLRQAERLYRRVLEVVPNHPEALHGLGLVAHQVGKQGIALDYIGRALDRDPSNAAYHLNLGVVHRGLRQLQEAAVCYEEALRLNPDYADAHYNLGVVLQEQGKFSEARSHYERALQLKPEHALAHNNLGTVLTEQGDIDGAVAHYREAVRLKPDHANALNNLGVALERREELPQAIAYYRRALRLKPHYADAHRNLGNALAKLGNEEEAIACYREALRLKPDHAEAHNSLGVTLREQGKLAEAMAHFEEAARLKPNRAETWNNLASALIDEGKFQAAAEYCEKALRLSPDCPMVFHNLGKLVTQGSYALEEDRLERMRSLLADGRLPLSEAALLHFTLGDVFDKQGRYNEAFLHYSQANRLRRQILTRWGKAFDPHQHASLIDRIIAGFNGAFFQERQSFGIDTEIPVFIVGMPRSGTTLVEQIVSSHPAVFGAGELRDISRLVAGLPPSTDVSEDGLSRALGLEVTTARVLAERHLQRLVEMGGGALRVLDKMPENYLQLGFIYTLFPRARVIHCRRNAMDVCLSCYFQNFKTVRFSTSLEDLGCYYRQYERLMAHWREVLPLRMIDVQYEELVANQEAVSRELIAFLGLDWDDRCLAFHENKRVVRTASRLQVRQPMYKGAVQRWKRYAAHLKPLVDALRISGPA